MISFRMDRFVLLAVQGTLLQHHSSNASILQLSASLAYIATGKSIALTMRTFVGKVMSLLFTVLCRFVIAFLPRSRRLLLSWLLSPSAVIMEPKKVKSVTVMSEEASNLKITFKITLILLRRRQKKHSKGDD